MSLRQKLNDRMRFPPQPDKPFRSCRSDRTQQPSASLISQTNCSNHVGETELNSPVPSSEQTVAGMELTQHSTNSPAPPSSEQTVAGMELTQHSTNSPAPPSSEQTVAGMELTQHSTSTPVSPSSDNLALEGPADLFYCGFASCAIQKLTKL